MKSIVLPLFLMTVLLSACSQRVAESPVVDPAILESYGSEATGELYGSEATGKLYFPTNSGTHPVVVDLHGCSGVWEKRAKFWVPMLLKQGFAVLKVDSFTPRGVSHVCDELFRVSPQQRTFDVAAAIRFILKDERLDSDNIFLLGMSHGGTTVLLTHVYSNPLFSNLRGAIAYYPYCPDTLPLLNTDLLVLIGAADDWTPAKRCSAMKIDNTRGNNFELVVYPGAYHVFDVPGVDRIHSGHQTLYNPTASKDSVEKVKRFLRTRLQR